MARRRGTSGDGATQARAERGASAHADRRHAPAAAGAPRAPSFGALLASWRRRSGLSQWRLSLRAGVSARHLSFLETGRARPTDAMLQRLVRALDVPPAGEDEMRVSLGLLPVHAALGAVGAAATSRPTSGGGALAAGVFETAARLGDTGSAAEVAERAVPLLRSLGIAHFHTGTIRIGSDATPRVERDPAGAPAERWLTRYEAMRYLPHDPLLREAARSHRPFAWSDVTDGAVPLARLERRIVAEAGEFGIAGGFVTPVRRLDGGVRAVSMMGDGRGDRDPAARLALHVIGLLILEQLERLGAGPIRPVLSAVQLDCLRWTLGGRDAAAIAQRLAWSERRVRAELRSACRALGVRDARQAAVRAVSLGLVRDA